MKIYLIFEYASFLMQHLCDAVKLHCIKLNNLKSLEKNFFSFCNDCWQNFCSSEYLFRSCTKFVFWVSLKTTEYLFSYLCTMGYLILCCLYLRTKMDKTGSKTITAGKSEAQVGKSEFLKEKVCSICFLFFADWILFWITINFTILLNNKL